MNERLHPEIADIHEKIDDSIRSLTGDLAEVLRWFDQEPEEPIGKLSPKEHQLFADWKAAHASIRQAVIEEFQTAARVRVARGIRALHPDD